MHGEARTGMTKMPDSFKGVMMDDGNILKPDVDRCQTIFALVLKETLV